MYKRWNISMWEIDWKKTSYFIISNKQFVLDQSLQWPWSSIIVMTVWNALIIIALFNSRIIEGIIYNTICDVFTCKEINVIKIRDEDFRCKERSFPFKTYYLNQLNITTSCVTWLILPNRYSRWYNSNKIIWLNSKKLVQQKLHP